MKKFTTKLLMSIIAVAFAFVALGTSTYAWFSMNTTVSVTGMEIGAKSNNTYLLIGEANNVATIRTGNATAVEFDPVESATVLPSKPKAASEVAADGVAPNYTTTLFAYGTDVVEDATSAAVPANWYTAISHNPGAAINFEGAADIHSLNNNGASDQYDFSKYVLTETVYLALALGSDDAYHLTVTPTITLKAGQEQTQTNITAVKVLVAVGDFYAILSTTSGTQNLYVQDTDNVLSGDTVLTANIYVYYDGSEAAVYTNNAANLAAAEVSLEFNVALKPASN